jgi:hypothetical protein
VVPVGGGMLRADGQFATFQTVSRGGYGAIPPLMQAESTPRQAPGGLFLSCGANVTIPGFCCAGLSQSAAALEIAAGECENRPVEAQLEAGHAGTALGVHAAEIEIRHALRLQCQHRLP